MAQRLELLTPAKINLFLRVTGRRPDGYHELDSVFLPISLFDRIVLEISPAQPPSVSIRCNWPEIPVDNRNLAVRAAERFLIQAGLRLHVRIDLHKEIPPGAGLGGGSSDAGAVLGAMASLYALGTGGSRTAPTAVSDALRGLALSLGADVPFFLAPRPARVGGIGEQISYLNTAPRLELAIAVPPLVVPTAEIYADLQPSHWSGPGPADLSPWFASGGVGELIVNDLETVAIARYPVIAKLKALLKDVGALAAAMSGSGGAVFGIFANREEVRAAVAQASIEMPAARFFPASVLIAP